MVRTMFLAMQNIPSFAGGIQPTGSLVLGHNYEQNGNDLTTNFPLGTANGSPVYANNWAAQGYGITNFGVGGLLYFVNTNINATFESGTFTVAWHFRTGANVVNGSAYLIGDGSTFNGCFLRLNGTLLQWNGGGSGSFSTSLAANTNYHAAVTVGSGTTTFYLNGSFNGGYANSAIVAGGTQYKIGNGCDADFQIYDYGVWNIAMNAGQITNIMNNLAP